MDQATELMKQGVAALRAGKRDEARKLLQAAVRANPRSDQAWTWLSAVVGDPALQRDCLKRALAINPSNEAARRGLDQLPGADAAAAEQPKAPSQPGQPQPEPAPTTPPADPTAQSQTIEPPPPPPLSVGPASESQPELGGLSGAAGSEPQADASLDSASGVPHYATLPPPKIAPCHFCSTPEADDTCPACRLPQSYDCPSCGLPIDLRESETCKCGESLSAYVREGELDHERLGDRYQKELYTAAAIKQWELALPRSAKPQALRRKLASAYMDVGLVEKAREHAEALKGA